MTLPWREQLIPTSLTKPEQFWPHRLCNPVLFPISLSPIWKVSLESLTQWLRRMYAGERHLLSLQLTALLLLYWKLQLPLSNDYCFHWAKQDNPHNCRQEMQRVKGLKKPQVKFKYTLKKSHDVGRRTGNPSSWIGTANSQSSNKYNCHIWHCYVWCC